MNHEPVVLFENDNHKCLCFHSLVEGDGIQSNQFLIIHDKHEALIDPGGDLTYTPLSVAISRHIKLRDLDYVLASHQDPDIIAAMDRWMLNTDCQVVVSKLWSRFLPHLTSDYMSKRMGINPYDRIVPLPDEGDDIPFGDSYIKAVPAHFLHSVGNFQFYDPVSKILFSGDMGASLVGDEPLAPVDDFEAHIPLMEGFHKRYMASNKVCRLWANRVRQLDVEMIVPQHGKSFKGKAMVNQFLDWASNLKCGVDLINERSYTIS